MRPIAPIVAVILLCPAAASPSAAEPPSPADLGRRIDAYVQPFLADGHLSGTLLVARGNDVVFERSWGMANYEHRVPNTPDTRFCVASVTKPMTVALVCRLAEEEKVLPDQTLSTWLPDFPRADEITVQHLLNHRACIPHRVTTPEQETVPRTAADMVELAAKAEMLPYEIGEKSVYSSAGYAVLARVCELASGMSYAAALDSLVFRPAGMTRSGHHDGRTVVPDRAQPYFVGRSGVVNGPLQDLSFLVGAGSVVTTPRDLHRMIRAVLDGSLGPYAAGLIKDDAIHWNGVTNGFRGFADWDRSTDTEVIFAGNLLSGAADYLQRDVPKIAAGEDVPVPARLDLTYVHVPEEVLHRYEGDFINEEGRELWTKVQDGELWAKQWLLLPTSETTFFSPQDYATVTVVLDDAGEVERLDWARMDGVWPWFRKAEDGGGPPGAQ